MFKLLFKINLKQMYLHHDFLVAHGLIAHGPDKAIGIDEDNNGMLFVLPLHNGSGVCLVQRWCTFKARTKILSFIRE